MKRAAFVVGVVLAGCAFDPSGLAPLGGGGDAGVLPDQVPVVGDAGAGGDAARDAGELADQVLVDAQLLDVAAPDASLYLAPCTGCAAAGLVCADDNVTPRDLPPRMICTHACGNDSDCAAPSAGCTVHDGTSSGTCRGARLLFMASCETYVPNSCVPFTGFGCSFCETSANLCLSVGPASHPLRCTRSCQQASDCPAPSTGCPPGGGVCRGPAN